MKMTKQIIIIVGILLLGFLGYYFYTSIGDIDPMQEVEFNSADTSVFEDDPRNEVDDLTSLELSIDSDLDELEDLDLGSFEGNQESNIITDSSVSNSDQTETTPDVETNSVDQTEQEIEDVIAEEENFDTELDSLESLDF